VQTQGQTTRGLGGSNLRAQQQQQYEAHLFFSISVYDEEAEGERARQPATLAGYTHSIGADALSLVGPFYRFGYRYLMGRNRALPVVLELPSGPINIQGFPMRYTKMSEQAVEDGYMLTGVDSSSFSSTDVNCLIEVSIVVMSDDDREQLTQYLHKLAPGAEAEPIPAQLRETAPPPGASYVNVI
jgi:hypothetical protein